MDSPEYKTLTHCYVSYVLTSCIEGSPGAIASQLQTSRILAPEDLQRMENPDTANNEKALQLQDTVLKQVQKDQRLFFTFIDSLKAAGPWTKKAVLTLETVYGVISGNHCRTSEEQSGTEQGEALRSR